MGREAVAVCHWQGQIAEAKLHLDSKYLQLRGGLRADIPRAAIEGVALRDEGVAVQTDGPSLILEFGPEDALRWQKALLKKPPTLAQKLGVSPQSPAYVLGSFDDAPLADALRGAQVDTPEKAQILIAVLMEEAQLSAASQLALSHPDKHIWMVHEKGKKAAVGDTMVRTHMRDLGFHR